MVRKFLILFLFMLLHSGYGELDIRKRKCEKKGNVTLTCNFIPKIIPDGISNVYLDLELGTTTDLALRNSTFAFSNWNQIKVLELRNREEDAYMIKLQDNCFYGLIGLEELKLHINCRLVICPDAFVGLGLVTTLDLSSSVRVVMNELIPALNGSNKLPKLRNLILSNFTLLKSSFVINETFVKVLQFRNISSIDISGSKVNNLNPRALFKTLKYLEVFNGSYMTIDDFVTSNPVQDDLSHIKTFDLSYAVLPTTKIRLFRGKYVIPDIAINFSDIRNHDKLKYMLSPETVNISGIVPHFMSVWIDNSSVKIDQSPHILTKTLIARQNNLRRLDVALVCKTFYFWSLEHLDFSDNGLEFFHPGILSCMPNLEKIDLSKNHLVKMAQEQSQVFEAIFSVCTALNDINLSKNELRFIPLKMFENVGKIEVIDLSNNRLEDVHFSLTGLQKLRKLDLQGNTIRILDSMSISYLNEIPNGNEKRDGHGIVILKSNPFSCSECQSKPSIEWLLTTNLVNISSQSLTCSNEGDKEEAIREHTLNHIKKICERTTVILSTTISIGIAILILLFVMLMVYRRKRIANKIQRRTNVINLLRDGEGIYEFAVFLAFSSDNEAFVYSNILYPLNENLQLMTGIDRKLVCTGDRHFRPGFYVHNESYRCLDTASVMVVVVSNSFCASEYCQNEINQAYVKKKPIVLMFIEHVDEVSMLPTLKELYQRNVRIVWSKENDVYTLKTTWENICTSVLDLIQ